MHRFRSLALAFLLLAGSAHGQLLEKLSSTVVLLQANEDKTVVRDGRPATLTSTNIGTGFLVLDEGTNVAFLVTAEHVAVDMKSGPMRTRTATIRGDNDTPIVVPLEDLVGEKEIRWVYHDKEDVAVVVLHPAQPVSARLSQHFLPSGILLRDTTAPSRERTLITLGFPLGIGVQEHFSPISRESKPASGLLSIERPDTKTMAIFFLLDNATIGGFSGAPLFLIASPFASSTGALVMPSSGTPPSCVGLITGTISDETGGKMAAVTPSVYILETMRKASTAASK